MEGRRYTLILVMSLCAPTLHAKCIPNGYQTIATRCGVPAEMLYALALVESGVHLQQGHRPWPWTLNVAGKAYRYANRQEACGALNRFVGRVSLKRIDVGLGQINLGWHGHNFSYHCEALIPSKNLHMTAHILRQRYDEQPGSWLRAAARYHHPAGGDLAKRYRKKVVEQLHLLAASSS